MADDVVTTTRTDFHDSVEADTSQIAGNIHVAGINSDSEDDQSTLDEPVSATLVRITLITSSSKRKSINYCFVFISSTCILPAAFK